ncbi:MAG: hypothetical protein VXY45_02605, partial [Pseudomonadota bacterium]|nr:hypothetical protein [Pseudomonadota bacterium]
DGRAPRGAAIFFAPVILLRLLCVDFLGPLVSGPGQSRAKPSLPYPLQKSRTTPRPRDGSKKFHHRNIY